MAEIFTPRLKLRPFLAADLPALLEAMNDWEVQQWLDSPPFPYGEDNGLRWIAEVARDHARGGPLTFAVAERIDDRLLGCVGLETDGALPHLGYWLHRRAWGRGIATEAAAAYLYYCRRKRMTRIAAFTDPANASSARVLEKVGFTALGEEQRHEPTRRGSPTWCRFEWRDES